MTLKSSLFYSTLLFALICIGACNGHDNNKTNKPIKDSLKTTVTKEEKKEPETKYERPPIVNIVDTLAPKRMVIYCKDSAANFERISLKLGKIYGAKLPEYIKKNNLKTAGAPMAWYNKTKKGYFFEAGVPVNKIGMKALPGVQIRELAAGKAVIAHFYGPFELLPQGYDAVKEWMKDNKKITAGAPYEIYLTDPFDKDGKPVDPYKIQTDIIFPVR